MKQLTTPYGELTLDRYPRTTDKNLQAWDAADSYLLNNLHERGELGRVLVINDTFGTITTAIHDSDVTLWSDSKLAEIAVEVNYGHNLFPLHYTFVPSTELPHGRFDTIVIKIPQTNAYFDDILSQLPLLMHEKTQLVCGGMVKFWTNSWPQAVADRIGHSDCSLTWKKARLIFSDGSQLPAKQKPIEQASYDVEPLDMTIRKLSNVYGQGYLDIGARILMQELVPFDDVEHIADLGCGSGELGLMALKMNPKANVEFIDESYQAVLSAQENVAANLPDCLDRCRFTCNDGMINKPRSLYGAILCNPPFHQQQTIGDHIAWGMMQQARRALSNHGELWLVGNRHLNYHVKMMRLFGNCEQVGGNKKFVVLKSIKQPQTKDSSPVRPSESTNGASQQSPYGAARRNSKK
ncbi:16S rRNA (guanine1207-N2)-methyltransferase/23S rRNA (guanine1835-N2)-methyltransferase [Sinobacterium caligoides]|uniref:16S rRNA (Guanine1207-N2)-methyltransferase/23S rRNA (Guanine1835-N2)-methyltransferase n=1 Tax=Sinobacterium caligoides TaxID=933926 RepID=A0A3N2DKX1_9GAMM|nr:methyltransferase [Sinobacterium caligoides]ROR99994.1 16S rRNA (guanine1207-N2)-methyltransferase/23S rRNA (guanine1835-N2)-methyltransferase [Sinobacterium caligoides]